jgi:hypothetical protein
MNLVTVLLLRPATTLVSFAPMEVVSPLTPHAQVSTRVTPAIQMLPCDALMVHAVLMLLLAQRQLPAQVVI